MGSVAAARGLSCSVARLPGPATEPESALAGGFLLTALPGELRVLAVAQGLFSCSMRTLSCSKWDLVSQPGIHPRLPALGVPSLTSGPPGKSQDACLSVHLPSPGVALIMPCFLDHMAQCRNVRSWRRAALCIHSGLSSA